MHTQTTATDATWRTTIDNAIALHDWAEFMNTQPVTEPTVTHFLDGDHHDVIREHLALYPLAVALVVEPQLLGQFDAETGLPCDPVSRGYRTLADCEAYCLAWRDTAALFDAEAEAYEDDIEDREFIRMGGA